MKETKKVRKDLLLEQIDVLRKMKIPQGWEVARLDVEFTRKGFLGEWATVIYDSMNNVFYAKTNKAIVYPGDEKALKEAIAIMHDANKIIKN